MPAHFVTWLFILAAGFIALTSLLLIKKKVPMNQAMGVRFKACFKSNELWYRINVFGGWLLLISSAMMIGLGVLFMWLFPKPGEWHVLYLAGAMVVLYLGATAVTYRYVVRVEKEDQTNEKI